MNISQNVVEGPWYAFLVEDISCWVCDHVPAIDLPAFPMIDEDGEATTWADNWGDLRQWWHLKFHHPVFVWATRKIKGMRNESTA